MAVFALQKLRAQAIVPVSRLRLCSRAIGWLLLVSFAGLFATFKLHNPDWLVQYEWLTFGTIRSIHLNAVAYGGTVHGGTRPDNLHATAITDGDAEGGQFALAGVGINVLCSRIYRLERKLPRRSGACTHVGSD